MAGDEVKRKKRRTHRRHGDTATAKPRRKSEDDSTTPRSVATADRPSDVEALRQARLAYLAKSPEDRRKEMKYEYVERTRTVSQVGEDKEKRRKVVWEQIPERRSEKPSRRSTKRTTSDRQPSREEESEEEYVYRKRDQAPARSESRPETITRSRTKNVEPSSRLPEGRRRAPERRHTEPARQKELSEDEVDQTREEHEPQNLRRRTTISIESPKRPTITKNTTSARTKPEMSSTIPSDANVTPRRPQSIFSGFLPPKPAPSKKVSCLTCGDDDVPASQAALLPCKHRMCNSCLKRIFTMSVTDPAHMPPRCCTDQHIDLKHVEKLFNDKFKVLWNRKFQEYKTKNRIYCPARKCGAWIKPHYITMEHGRKVGRCKQCKTRVCAICSQKMHTTRECPKDPETKAFVEAAKEKGWQRCYSCHAMVELKEGCNHMTCRCTAEFCMVCGLKWKSCDCPWFNYEAVDPHLGDPLRYQQEMDRRRNQIDRDEALARRMQQMGLRNADESQEDVVGLGNAANHHMNQNFIQQAREVLTANYAQAGQAAQDLLNRMMAGRENLMPGMPMDMEQMLEMLRQGGMQDPAEGQEQGRRSGRRGATRRRHAVVSDETGGHHVAPDRGQERRLQDWANSVAS